MVLLSNSDEDFERLWYNTGGYNVFTGTEETQTPAEVARGGNFRSAEIDNWTNASFDSVKVAIDTYRYEVVLTILAKDERIQPENIKHNRISWTSHSI